VGNVLYISGIIGVNENDNLVMGGLVEESHQIFRNLKKNS
jgi:enamine deaminase RidA (YjgF/YER057c/UK114 family)